MKTIEKDVSISNISKALLEVWEWKNEVYNDIKNKTFEEKQKYYENGLKEAVRLVKGKLKKNPDGSYSII
ncbi:MAG: hypothetical protein HY754_08005 [Nitrospirae bacterium]|nr:hypothetical protein [Nitrospirota bacterium]